MSSVDNFFASETEKAIAALTEAGHDVETPCTGSVIVDGAEITSDRWDALMVVWDGDVDAIVEM